MAMGMAEVDFLGGMDYMFWQSSQFLIKSSMASITICAF